MIDAEKLAVSLGGENPAGENLEYDPLYVEMETLAVAIPATEMGKSVIEGRGPDWKKLGKNCVELWKKTRDLRVASYLTVSETAQYGLAGLAAGFKLLGFLVTSLWEEMYPRLDPADDNDPIERLNILAMLSPEAGAINDPIMFISRLRETRLVPSLHYTLRDLLISTNEIETAGTQAVDGKLLHAELMNVPISEIQAQAALAAEVGEQITQLCAAMNGKMQDAAALSMAALSREVDKLRNFYNTHLNSFDAAVPDEAGAEEQAAAGEARPQAAQAGALGAGLANYRVASRSEALLLLRKVSEYFQAQEPNSPIPHLINRALRFSEMSFIDLLGDIAPDALSRGRDVLGIKEDL